MTVVEVLSPSTEAYDRSEKLDHYQRIAGLDEIVLVGYESRRIDVYRREGAEWRHGEYREGAAMLPSIGCELPFEEVYRDPFARREIAG